MPEITPLEMNPPVDVHTPEITPLGSTTEHARPEMNPPVDMHTPEKPPPQYLQNDWLERLFKNLSVYSIFHFLLRKTMRR